MNDSLNILRSLLRSKQSVLSRQFSVRRMGIFGSFAQGDATSNSDVDVLVEFDKPISMFRFIELEQKLSQILDKQVDLVTPNALKPIIKQDILRDVVYV